MSPVLKLVLAVVCVVIGVKAIIGDDEHIEKSEGLVMQFVPLPILGLLSIAFGVLLLVSIAVPPADHLVTTIEHLAAKDESLAQKVAAWFFLVLLLVAVVGTLGSGAEGVAQRAWATVGMAVVGVALFGGLLILDAGYLHLI